MVTLHRPSNVDDRQVLSDLIDVLVDIAGQLPLVFPIHPRTKERLDEFGLFDNLRSAPSIRIAEPLGYLDFLCLTCNAKLVVSLDPLDRF